MQVNWIKNSQNNDWFDFLRLNLDAPYFSNKRGVYVIWYASPSTARVVRVGSGNIGERLRDHRSNVEITKYSAHGQLKVSWIVVDNENEIQGIEVFLADFYSPLVGENFPRVPSIRVNLIGQ